MRVTHTRERSTRAGISAWPLLLGLALAGGVVWYGFGPGAWFGSQDEQVVEGATVQRGPLKISVVERGNLKAADSVGIKSELEGQATILFLAPEGTVVKEGDLVCELDATSQIDRRLQQQISERNADAALIKSQKNYEIQKSQNDSDVKSAEQQLFFADTDLRKFLEGERRAQEAQADEAIKLAEEEFTRATEKLGWSEKLFGKGFLTNTELEADKLSLSRAEIQLEQKKRDKDLLTRFQLPRDEAELTSKLDEGKRELERVKLQASARIIDYEADMKTKEAQLELEREKLLKLETQIKKAKMHAPRSGMVVYSQEEGGRYGSSQPIKEGTSVRERQEIVTIPSAAGMVAQVSLHESVLKMVQPGQACSVKVDALANREFGGRVRYVAVLPDQNSWFANPNTRLYRTEVAIEDGHPDMRPGMSCSIEILVENIVDTLYVPVQSVFRNGADNIAFVRAAGEVDMRVVEVGKYNDRWVQVLSGLTQGQTVLLSPPTGFSPAPLTDKASDLLNTPEANAASHAAGVGAGDGQRGVGGVGGAPSASVEPGAPSNGGERGAGGERGGAEDTRARMANMSEEERTKMAEQWRARMANMTEEERAKAMEQFQGRRGGGDAPGGRASESSAPAKESSAPAEKSGAPVGKPKDGK